MARGNSKEYHPVDARPPWPWYNTSVQLRFARNSSGTRVHISGYPPRRPSCTLPTRRIFALPVREPPAWVLSMRWALATCTAAHLRDVKRGQQRLRVCAPGRLGQAARFDGHATARLSGMDRQQTRGVPPATGNYRPDSYIYGHLR